MAVRLTELATSCGGCAAKWSGGGLEGFLEALVGATNGRDDLLVGLDPFDDAAVVRWPDGRALVSTLDFFPAIVDDPSDFGRIAAANACSDIFAMGGDVLVGLSIAGFPASTPPDAVEATLLAAAAIVREAGGDILGGHTIRTAEPIFGLAVQGSVDPAAVWRKGGARPGDVLVLSKPVGTGLVINGHDEAARAAAIAGMGRTNRAAAAALHALDSAPHAVTDVTGFGLAGHSSEVAERSGVRVVVHLSEVPVYDGARESAGQGLLTSGDASNRAYVAGRIEVGVDDEHAAIAFDPQTSGGLLAAVHPDQVDELAVSGFHPVATVEDGSGVVLAR